MPTGAVVAVGAFLSDKALYVATTVKLIQNIMIGVIAFAVAVYWVSRVEKTAHGPRPSVAGSSAWLSLVSAWQRISIN